MPVLAWMPSFRPDVPRRTVHPAAHRGRPAHCAMCCAPLAFERLLASFALAIHVSTLTPGARAAQPSDEGGPIMVDGSTSGSDDETMGSPGMRSRGLPVMQVGTPAPASAYKL